MTSTRDSIAVCGWCRTILPQGENGMVPLGEATHHFFIVHGIGNGSQSVNYLYPARLVENEIAHLAVGTTERQ